MPADPLSTFVSCECAKCFTSINGEGFLTDDGDIHSEVICWRCKAASAFAGEFMPPEIVFGQFWQTEAGLFPAWQFSRKDAANFSNTPYRNISKTEPGYYSRLSAPGYLDCTDWSGPFKTEAEALADLLQMYVYD